MPPIARMIAAVALAVCGGGRRIRAGLRQPLQLDRDAQLQAGRRRQGRRRRLVGVAVFRHRRLRRARDRRRSAHDRVDRAQSRNPPPTSRRRSTSSRPSTACTTRSNGACPRARRSRPSSAGSCRTASNPTKTGSPTQVAMLVVTRLNPACHVAYVDVHANADRQRAGAQGRRRACARLRLQQARRSSSASRGRAIELATP